MKPLVSMIFAAHATCVLTLGDGNIYDFTLNVLKRAFPTANCVYVIKGEDSGWEIVEAALMQLNIPTVSLRHTEARLDEFYCYRYIVISKDYPQIKNLFVRNAQQKILQFRAHSRVVVFHNGNQSFASDDVFLMAPNFHGLDLITVQSRDDSRVTVKLVRDDSVLALWSNEGFSEFNPAGFERKEWTPNFTIGKSTITFNVSLFHCPPYVYYDPNLGVSGGVDHKILKYVSRGWPLSLTPYSGGFRDLWRNVMGDLEQGVSNMGLCSLWPITITTRNLSMSLPYTQHCATFLVPKPHLTTSEDYIFQSNQTEFGLITLVAGLATAAVFTLFAWVYRHIFGKRNRYRSYTFSFIETIRIIALGPPSDPPHVGIFRFLIAGSCLAALLLTTCYSSSITTILTYPRFTKTINTVEDMVSENFSWGGLGNSLMHTAERSINPFVAILNKNYRTNCTVAQRNEYIRKKENIAIFVKTTPEKYITNVDTLDQYGLTHMKLLKECTEVNLAVLAFNRNSAFPRIFDGHIFKFLEYGFITQWHKHVLNKKAPLRYIATFYSSIPDMELVRLPLTIKNLRGAFYLLFVGWFLAFFAFVIEVSWAEVDKVKNSQ